MKIIRVFPRRTKATPDDEFAYSCRERGPIEDAFPDLAAFGAEPDEIHVSVSFTQDRARAEQLAEVWKRVAPIKIGGVGWNDDAGGEFVPGRYIKPGYTITSRGCPRRCWFCSVHRRDPVVRVLPVQDGYNVLDDNLLACPRPHVEEVFAMLRQ